MRNKNFMKIVDEVSEQLKKFCKRTAGNCKDGSYTWEDFFQEALMQMWKQYKYGKSIEASKYYLNKGQWAVYGLLDRINAKKRDKSRQVFDEETGVYYVRKEN